MRLLMMTLLVLCIKTRLALRVLVVLMAPVGLHPDPALHLGKWLWGSASRVRPQP